ncbi:ABC transporter permease [Natrarchaeobius oligotrophus]|uniref:ABC transporter permease n=1 Tax=Natrarchaeobius chitinivorans TaxID=1679083 RepID=A0A3N6MWM3_NATCH|nr:ABC transporter permease [Natrarchaeobius chitinivorans]RQH02381.1 ABC transporter permease [Natrarchaeobius chitinivorans]
MCAQLLSRRKLAQYRKQLNGTHARVSGILFGLLAWFVLASIFPADLMPYPFETLVLTGELIQSGVAFSHLFVTLWRTLLGFLGAFILGGVIGVLMGVSNYGEKFFVPYIVIGLSIPAIAWAAISTLSLGLSPMAPVVATIATTFPFIAINVWKGVQNIQTDLLKMSSAFGVSNLRLLRRVILPNTAPALFSASRFGLAISWKIVTIAEIFASSSGVGYMLIRAYESYQYELAWAWAVLFMIVILLIEYGVFRQLEKRAYAYRSTTDVVGVA